MGTGVCLVSVTSYKDFSAVRMQPGWEQGTRLGINSEEDVLRQQGWQLEY